MNQRMFIVIAIILAAVMCVGLLVVLARLAQSDAPDTTVSANISTTTVNTISVSAEGSAQVIPDVAYIMVGVEVRNEDVKTAQVQAAQRMDTLLDALSKFGLEPEDITTTNYNVNPIYEDYSDGVPSTYMVSNRVKLRVKQVDKLGEIIDAVTAAGSNTISSIYFDVLDSEQAFQLALADAMETARTRALALAQSEGLNLGKALQITQGGSSYNPYVEYRSFDTTEESSTPIMRGEQTVSASVQVTYGLVHSPPS